MSRWKMVRLGEICDLDNGYAFKSSDYVDNSKTLNCRMSNIRPNATFDALYNVKYLPDEFAVKYSNYLLNDGDLIIAMTDMANDPKILGVPTVVETQGYKMLLNQRVGRLRFLTNEIDRQYLKYALCQRQVRNHFKKFAGGGLQINVGKKEILSVQIPLPPFETQKQIAKVLETVQELLVMQKQQYTQLDNFVKSVFNDMFGDPISNEKGWEIKTLKDVCEKITDGTHQTPVYSSEGYIFLSSKNVTSGTIDWDNVKYIPEYLHKELSKRLAPQKNDILLAKNGTTGVAAIVDRDCIFDIYVSLALLRPLATINPIYLLHAINSDACKYQFNRSLKGIGVPNLHLNSIKKVNILVPPISLQNQFALVVSKIEGQKALVKKAMDETQYLFNSLMSQYFE